MTEKNDLLETARDRYKRAVEAEQDNRAQALEAIKFRNLEQWDPMIKRDREGDPEGARPCLVVDKTNQYLRQICNEERQNRPSVKVRPVDDQGDPEVAEIYQGIVRHIEDRSSADIAYDTAYEHAADGGFGYLRVLTEYEDELSFQQDIRIKRIRNRFQVLLDPDRQEPDGSDAKWAFVVEKMPRTEYEAQYPKADPLDFDAEAKVHPEWVEKDHVIVAEYFRIEQVKKTICLWPDGSVSIKGAKPKDGLYAYAAPVKERETAVSVVKWSKINAKEELESRDWPGKYIPIAECIGNELDIEGKSVKYGLLRGAIEPQKIHNYAASSFVESVALAPRAQWVAAEGQIEGYEELYRTANRRNIAVLPYKPVVAEGNNVVPPPQRVAPPGISAGWQQTMVNTEHDVQASMGMYDASLGETSNERSGRAIIARQRKSDTATFHYMDNLTRTIRHVGRILVDLIPKIYDTERVARILGEDGNSAPAQLNPNQDAAVVEEPLGDGRIKKIYNLGVGKYDVTVAVGPSYSTKRAEAVDWLSNAIQAAPDLMKVAGDILFRNMDAPGAEEVAKRLKKLLPPELNEQDGNSEPVVQTPTGPVSATDAAQLIAGLMQQAAQAEEALKKAGDIEQAERAVQSEFAKADAKKAELEAILDKIDAARRELALSERLAAEQLKNRELQARNSLQEKAHQVERQADQVDAAREELDGILKTEVEVPQ